MKVLLLTNMYPTAKRVFYGIFVKEYVDSLLRAGVAVDVFFTDASEARLKYFSDILRLKDTLKNGTYDIIHSQHTFCIHQLILAGQTGKHRPIVLTLHEAEILLPGNVSYFSLDIAGNLVYSKRLKRWAMNAVDCLVSVEESLPEAASYKKKYDVIAPGINLDVFQPMDKNECRKKLNLPLDETVLLFPADPNRSVHKGYALFQEALNSLKKQPRVVLGGKIPHDEMAVYMNASDVVVQASNFEASPMVIKEAMACNIPVVSTDVGDTKLLFGNTEGYFLSERVASDFTKQLEKAIAYGKRTAGRERILQLKLSLDDVANKYINLYQRLLHEASVRSAH
ncbi:MAG: glycosyltransferase family 4 protein [Bacteroidota bacterium]